MTSLMLYNSGWTEFNREMATNKELQAAFSEIQGNGPVFDPKVRAFLYYITLAENGYNLRCEGLLSRKEYKRLMALAGKFVRQSEGFDFDFIRSLGYSSKFVGVLERESR